MRSSPPADRAGRPCERRARRLLALTAFLLAWAALHARWWQEGELVDTPTYEALRGRDRPGRGAVPGLRARVPAARAAGLRRAVARRRRRRVARAVLGRHSTSRCCSAASALVGLVWWTLVALGASGAGLYLPLALVAVAPLLLGSLVLTRFDLWAALLVSAALAALLVGRDRLGAGLLGAAVAAKLYPAVLVPLAAVWIWRRRGRREAARRGGVFAAVLAVCVSAVPAAGARRARVEPVAAARPAAPARVAARGPARARRAQARGGVEPRLPEPRRERRRLARSRHDRRGRQPCSCWLWVRSPAGRPSRRASSGTPPPRWSRSSRSGRCSRRSSCSGSSRSSRSSAGAAASSPRRCSRRRSCSRRPGSRGGTGTTPRTSSPTWPRSSSRRDLVLASAVLAARCAGVACVDARTPSRPASRRRHSAPVHITPRRGRA